MDKVMSRIPDLRLLISCIPDSASRPHVELRGSTFTIQRTVVLEGSPGKFRVRRNM